MRCLLQAQIPAVALPSYCAWLLWLRAALPILLHQPHCARFPFMLTTKSSTYDVMHIVQRGVSRTSVPFCSPQGLRAVQNRDKGFRKSQLRACGASRSPCRRVTAQTESQHIAVCRTSSDSLGA